MSNRMQHIFCISRYLKHIFVNLHFKVFGYLASAFSWDGCPVIALIASAFGKKVETSGGRPNGKLLALELGGEFMI